VGFHLKELEAIQGFLTISGNPNHAHIWPEKRGIKTQPAFY